MNKIFLLLILLLFSCKNKNGAESPKDAIQELVKHVLNHDEEKSKMYIEEMYWEYLIEDLNSRKKFGQSSATIYLSKIKKINCNISKKNAVCSVCSIFPDSIVRCSDVKVLKKHSEWVVSEGIYIPVCCD